MTHRVPMPKRVANLDSQPMGCMVGVRVACLLLGVFACAPPSVAEDWPRWRGPRGDGTWHGPSLPEQWPQSGLKQIWRQPLGGGYAGVTVAEGRVLVMDRQAPTESEPSIPEVERVLAFDQATGRPLWQHTYSVRYGDLDYGTGPRAAPTYHAGRVYTLGAVGHVRCLNAADGTEIWGKDLVADHAAELPEWGLAASPFLWRDLVIVHGGVRPDGCFIAYDAKTGQERWRAGSDPAGYATPILIECESGQQLIGWTPANIVSLEPAIGKILWSIPYPVTYGVSIATPIAADNLVFVAGYWEGSKAIRLGTQPSEAELAWEENRFLRGLMSQPLHRDGFVYLLDKQYGLTCFELATGTKRWDDGNQLTPRGRNPQATLVWLGDSERIIALNAEGELVLARLRPEGYRETSRTKIIGPTWAHPAYAGDCVFARDDQELICVSLVAPADGS
jgi:outer membrane protein assembly factor BamB